MIVNTLRGCVIGTTISGWLGLLCYIGEKPFLVCLVDEHFEASLKKVEIICAIAWCDCSLGKD